MKYYIGIDQGTTLTTAVVANQNMQILAKASVSHTNSYPKDGWVREHVSCLLKSMSTPGHRHILTLCRRI